MPTRPLALVATGYYLRCVEITASAARQMDKHGEADRFEQWAAATRKNFADIYVDAHTGLVANGPAASQATAIYQGLIDPDMAPKALELMISDLQRLGWRVNAGIHATSQRR